jgi:hypothetical protein
MARIIKLETITDDGQPIAYIDVAAVQMVYDRDCTPERAAPEGTSWIVIEGGHRFNVAVPPERLASLVWGDDLPTEEP